VRGRSGAWWPHLAAPLIGMAILIFVVINANVLAQVVGLIWLALGALALLVLYLLGRRPVLGGVPADRF
jgi:hypothetical protein